MRLFSNFRPTQVFSKIRGPTGHIYFDQLDKFSLTIPLENVSAIKWISLKEETTHSTGKITPRHKTHHHDQTTDALPMKSSGQT